MSAAPQAAASDSSRHLFGRLGIVEERVRATVAGRRAVDPDPDDRFRGLYIPDSEVDALLAGGPGAVLSPPPSMAAEAQALEAWADHAEASGADLRLRRLARCFGLDAADLEILLIAVAPDLDWRFERLYAYLNDDVSRRRATVRLAIELCPGLGRDADRARFGAQGALVAGGILVVEEPDAPFLGRSLRVPDRVIAHLLGDDTPDPAVAALLAERDPAAAGPASPVAAPSTSPAPDPLERALAGGARLCYLREQPGASGLSAARAALARLGAPCIAVDLRRMAAGDDAAGTVALACREARLSGGFLVAGPVDVLADRGPEAVRAFGESQGTVVLTGSRAWDPGWSRQVPVLLDAAPLALDERSALWRRALDGSIDGAVDPGLATVQFRLTPEQVVRAARSAQAQAQARGTAIGVPELHAGARSQNGAGLERLARRVEPAATWDDLVLPVEALTQLRELTARARRRDLVFGAWGMRRAAAGGRGVTALFAGESGTGKTLSAEVIAADLGLSMYVIDLSTVVDKYVGETEKNLERIFAEAERLNAVLLFDEADAIFGKRSDVSDAHDRYANVEVAYLLQRMERFDGLALLTTNLRANVDEAFTRRLDCVVDFPMPEPEDRLSLWRLNLRPGLPQAPGIDLAFLARAFKVSGGNIHNIVLTAAFLAADEGHPVSMSQLIRATEREYRKLGRLCVPDEFGPYYPLIHSPTAHPPTAQATNGSPEGGRTHAGAHRIA